MDLKILNKFKRDGNKELRESRKDANTMIIDEKTKTRQLRKLDTKDIPQESFEKEYAGVSMHLLGKSIDGEYWSIDVPDTMLIDEAPIDLYVAKHCAPEVEEVFGLSSSTIQKLKVGIFAVLILGIVIVTFLIVTASSGGTVQ